jgi:hypothetical protein
VAEEVLIVAVTYPEPGRTPGNSETFENDTPVAVVVNVTFPPTAWSLEKFVPAA